MAVDKEKLEVERVAQSIIRTIQSEMSDEAKVEVLGVIKQLLSKNRELLKTIESQSTALSFLR